MADGPVNNKVVRMVEDSQCPDCKTTNKLPRFEFHKADIITCGACGSKYWNVGRIACSCDTSHFMIMGELSSRGGLLIGCLGCGVVADSRDLEEYLASEVVEDAGSED